MKRKELDSVYADMSMIFYGAVDPRRRQEYKDSRMVKADKRAVANLPAEAIHQEFDQNTYVEHFRDNMFEVTESDKD